MKTVQEVIEEYRSLLLKSHSPVTIKNYISDIYHFVNWFANYYSHQFQLDLLSKTSISEYKRLRGSKNLAHDDSLSQSSISRHLSSLRSFCAYLYENDLIDINPFEELASEANDQSQDIWRLSEFKQFLKDKQSSDLTVKYYINDIQGFRTWIHEVAADTEHKKPEEILDEHIILEYKNRLTHTLLQSPLTINRKLSSIRNYATFLKITIEKQVIPNVSSALPISALTLDALSVELEEDTNADGKIVSAIKKSKDLYLGIEEKAAQVVASTIISAGVKQAFKPQNYDKRIQNIDQVLNTLKNKNVKREFFAPHTVSQDLPKHKKLLHHLRHTRPKWYKEYHTYPFVHYVHFGVLVGAAVIAGFFVYNSTLGKAQADLELQALKPATKILSFRGRLLDKEGTPITTSTDVKFALYTGATDTTGSMLWQETQHNITPDEEGMVNLVVGSVTPIPKSLSEADTPLFLGVKIGNSEELTPRKPIGSAFAANTETVQGMLPITSANSQRNVLLALDGSGNLSIGGVSNPTFQATGGDFTFSGETLILATNPSSNGNVRIEPDGNGKIQIGQAIITQEIGKNFGLQNVVEIEGGLGIMATSSAHAALLIQQNSRGDLISASTSGLTRFAVDNQGTIVKGAWAGDFIPTTFGGLGASVTAASAGELLYSISNTKYGTLKAGISGQCLTSGGASAPTWTACGGLTQLNGTLFSAQNLDFLLGGSSTTSARFAFINMNSGTPTFKIGSALGIDTNGIIQAYNGRDLILGSSSTKNILLASSGNVGIGNTNPTRTLDVTGTFGGNTELYVDGDGTRDITISGKALIYDLEKSTGGADNDGTTTYNITGLPDVNGTISYLYLKVSKGVTANPRTQTVQVKVNGTLLATVSTTNPILSSEEVKHVTIVRSNDTWHIQGDPGMSNTADLAEWTPYTGALPMVGEIVSISENGKLEKSQKAHDTRLAGVVSTKPAITIGPQTKDSVRLALSGRIPVVATTINGDISAGDPITSSVLSGIGMKPSKNSPIIGKTLSSFPIKESCKIAQSIETIPWPEDDGTNKTRPCFKVPASSLPSTISNTLATKYGVSSEDYIYIGKVMVLANLSWSQTDDFLTSSEAITISEEGASNISSDTTLLSLMDTLQGKTYSAQVGGKIIEEIQVFSNLTSAVITSGLVSTKNAVVSGTITAYNIVGDTISAATADIETLTAGNITSNTITSPLARINTVQTDTIEPISEDLKVKLSSPSSEFQVTNAAGDAVSSIDSEGNIITQGNLTAQDSSISGTLRAGKLIAGDIEGLENQVSSFASKFLDEYEETSSIPSYQLGDSLLTASVSASFGTFHHGLISLGASTFGSLTAIDQISVGTDFVLSEGGINTLGRTLELQPLRQGAISLMAGAVSIETDGRLMVSNDAIFAKNVTVAGTLFANSISGLPGQDIHLTLQGNEHLSSRFKIHNSASNSAVFEVNPAGDVSASGSGTFSKLNFKLVGQAVAANDLEAYATTSAGTAFLKAFRPELTIYNNNVTENSLIYVTPKNNTDNNVLFLLRQTSNGLAPSYSEGSFTVGVSQLIDHDVEFNWMIVN